MSEIKAQRILRKPNRSKTGPVLPQSVESKLVRGNKYVLKERDARHVVTCLRVLGPGGVTVLVVTIPAIEIIQGSMEHVSARALTASSLVSHVRSQDRVQAGWCRRRLADELDDDRGTGPRASLAPAGGNRQA
jgi:hypothetical protein